MRDLLPKYWPLIISLLILFITFTALFSASTAKTNGFLIYALDDSYIHMAMAKNLALNGVWGVTGYNFSSTSSSPLWTSLIAATYLIFGVNEFSPLILNIGFSILALFFIFAVLKKNGLPSKYIFLILLGITFFTPLPTLIFTGQEHILHIITAVLFVYFSAKVLSRKTENIPKSQEIFLLILPPIAVLTRYETLFFVFVVCILLIIRKRWSYSVLLGTLALIPAIIYGIISVAHGWYFLPNSILTKGNLTKLMMSLLSSEEGFSSSFLHAIAQLAGLAGVEQLVRTPEILFPVLSLLIFFVIRSKRKFQFWQSGQLMIVISIATIFLHMQFARTGWFRYEAYLVALSIFTGSITLYEYISVKRGIIKFNGKLISHYAVISLLFVFPVLFLTNRAVNAIMLVPKATANIFEQQHQMALFLRRFYQGKAVAANDIGAINFMANINCIDLAGLGNIEVARSKRLGTYDSGKMAEIAKRNDVKIALIYDYWFDKYGGIPESWTKVGEWKISNNVVCGGNVVSFYAVDPSEAENLTHNLRSFSHDLPEAVSQTGVYIRQPGHYENE